MKNTTIGSFAILIAIISVFVVQAKNIEGCSEGRVWFFYTIGNPVILTDRLNPENYRPSAFGESVICSGTVTLCAICAYPDKTGLSPSIKGEEIEEDLINYDPTATSQYPISAYIMEDS